MTSHIVAQKLQDDACRQGLRTTHCAVLWLDDSATRPHTRERVARSGAGTSDDRVQRDWCEERTKWTSARSSPASLPSGPFSVTDELDKEDLVYSCTEHSSAGTSWNAESGSVLLGHRRGWWQAPFEHHWAGHWAKAVADPGPVRKVVKRARKTRHVPSIPTTLSRRIC
jgi:hypothetical protein